MATYLSPGVYMEEVPGSPPIAGVGTSTAAFLGVVDTALTNPGGGAFAMPTKPDGSGPFTVTALNTPELVTNFEQFKVKLGDFHAANEILAHAVYGFFKNGGTRCWVVRVSSITDAAAGGAIDAALKKLEAIDEIAIVAAPGAISSGVQNLLIDHCATATKDRVAILDGSSQTATLTPAAISNGTKNSAFAALYFPWLQADDPIRRGAIVDIPPSGHLAGIYSRVDQVRGVHKAPANEIVNGARALKYRISKNEQDGLNPAGINCIRELNGGIRVWGARTLGGDANGSEKYISVRRTLNFIEESIEEGTQFAVFESNDQKLWKRLTRSVSAFLEVVWKDGALFGSVREQAFYVRCDESLNTPAVRDLGRVIIEVGVAIVRPAEFVIFRIEQGASLPTA